ncbi:unnamed protein product, partial [Tetraodon nigroviridis]
CRLRPFLGHLWLRRLPPVWPPGALPVRGPHLQEECHPGRHGHAEGLAERAPKEPLPHQGGEDHAGHHHQDDADAGLHLVRQRAAAAEEGEQDDLDAPDQERGRGGRPGPGAQPGRGGAPEDGRGAGEAEPLG